MTFLFYLMRAILYARFYFHRFTATGPFDRDRACPHLSFQPPQNATPLKKALFRYHVKQFHASSCSVASVANVINALLALQGRADRVPVTQQDLLEQVRTAHWKERMGPDGYQGRRGLPLPVLGRVVRSALSCYGIACREVTVVQATRDPADMAACRRQLRSRLIRSEAHGDGIIIAHFDQGTLVTELNIPHISPVGGYDPVTGRVILLDVDPEHPLPYSVSFDTFYKGISTNYLNLFRFYGYGRGGYIYIRL